MAYGMMIETKCKHCGAVIRSGGRSVFFGPAADLYKKWGRICPECMTPEKREMMKADIEEVRRRGYCTQNDGNCSTCSLVNYGRDCQNIEIRRKTCED